MPIYQFSHPEHPIIIEVVQSMKEPHIYIDEEGVEWTRVWDLPNASIDTKIDPWSASDFSRKTGEKKGTMGDLWDQSKEMSQERAKQCGGTDPVKKKYEKDWSAKRRDMKYKK